MPCLWKHVCHISTSMYFMSSKLVCHVSEHTCHVSEYVFHVSDYLLVFVRATSASVSFACIICCAVNRTSLKEFKRFHVDHHNIWTSHVTSRNSLFVGNESFQRCYICDILFHSSGVTWAHNICLTSIDFQILLAWSHNYIRKLNWIELFTSIALIFTSEATP